MTLNSQTQEALFVPQDNRDRKKIYLLLAAVTLLGLLFRIYYLWEVSGYSDFQLPAAGLDAGMYHNLAKQVAAGNLLLGKDVYFFSPLYAYFLGGLYFLFGDSFWVARIANVILGTATIALIYISTYRFFLSNAIALTAALGVAIYGPFLVYNTSGLKTSLNLFLSALLLLLLADLERVKRNVYFLLPGVILGLVFSIRGQIFLFFAGICAWLLLIDSSQAKWYPLSRFSRVIFLVSGFVISIAPFAARNYFVANDFVLTSSVSGIHLYIGNHEGASGRYSGVRGVRSTPVGHFYDARTVAERETGKSLSASQVSSYWKSKALDFIKKNPGAFIGLLWKKTVFLLNTYESPNNLNYQYLVKRSSFLSFFPGYGLLLPLGLCGMFLAFMDYRRLFPLYLFFITNAVAIVLAFINGRYRLPLTIVLFPFAGFFVIKMAAWIRNRRLSYLISGIVLFILFIFIAQEPSVKKKYLNEDIKKTEERVKIVEREKAILDEISSRHDASEEEKSRMLADLAEVKYRQAEFESAIEIAQQSLSLNPSQPLLWHRLAFMYNYLGNDEKAQEARKRAGINPVNDYRLRNLP